MELIYITLIVALIAATASIFKITSEAKEEVRRRENQVYELRDDLQRERNIVKTVYDELAKVRKELADKGDEIRALHDKENCLQMTIRALLKEKQEEQEE